MHYWILTDVAGKHGVTDGGWFAEITPRGPATEVVERFGTKADAMKRAAKWRKRGYAALPQKREVVVVAVRADDGNVLFEFASRTAAAKFCREAHRDLGAETAIEVASPRGRKRV